MSTIDLAPPPAPEPAQQPTAMPTISFGQGAPAPVPEVKTPRLVSLDIFRGVTIAAMILVNNQPDPKYWPLEHVDWHGWTPTDLIFPFFLFIVGVATPFSLGKRAAGETRMGVLSHIWARALSLFVLGELLTGLPYNGMSVPPPGYGWITGMRITLAAFSLIGVFLLLVPWKSKRNALILPALLFVLFYLVAFICHLVIKHNTTLGADFNWGNGLLSPTRLRIPGVLQRIGICYGVAATIGLYFGWQMVFMWAVALMALYSTLMLTVPFTHKSEVRIPFVYESGQKVVGELTHANNLSRRIDEWLLIRPGRWNHAYGAYPDNEGALSTLPAIAEVLLGILAGVWLRTFRPAAERGMGLLVFGVVALLAGLALDRWLMPINKNIWTPSFTVFTVGMALLCLGTCFFFVDVLGKRGWAFPFKVYGMNAIAAFVVSGLVVRLGLFLKVHRGEQTTSVWTFYQHAVENAVVRTSDALHVAAIKAPENLSLTFAISYVLVILVLMWILYLCKIFVKV